MYEIRQVHGLWFVFFGDEAVTKGFRDATIARDFAAVLNAARG